MTICHFEALCKLWSLLQRWVDGNWPKKKKKRESAGDTQGRHPCRPGRVSRVEWEATWTAAGRTEASHSARSPPCGSLAAQHFGLEKDVVLQPSPEGLTSKQWLFIPKERILRLLQNPWGLFFQGGQYPFLWCRAPFWYPRLWDPSLH